MRVYTVRCSFRNSKLVAWSRQYTAKSKADAIQQAKRGSTLGTDAVYTAVLPTISNANLTSVERAAVKLGNLPADFSEMDRVSSPSYRKAERAVTKETARRQRY